MSLQVGAEITVKIEKIAFGGQGIARHEKAVIFVPFSAPGDALKVRITKQEKNFLNAEIVEIINPSSERQTPPCPHYGTCGGCNLQHLTTESQLAQKRGILKDNLEKLFAKKHHLSEIIEALIKPFVPSPKSWRYRNRIQPNLKDKKIGFFGRESHSLVAISDCLICEEPLAQELKKIESQFVAGELKPGRYEVQLNQDLSVEIVAMSESREGFGFAQVNRFQNMELIEHVLGLCSPGQDSRILDLYSGAGNFTLPMAKKFKNSVVAVELSSILVQHLNEKLHAQKGARQISSYCSDVELFLRRFAIHSNDVVVLDPPRAGASEPVLRTLAESGPQQIIYISCDPAALARDLDRFFTFSAAASRKYKISSIQGFEMFPQTDHMETILDLRIDTF